MTDKTMEALLVELNVARNAYDEAAKAASIARNNETDTLNRLNAAQKAVSARMETLMKDAPRDTDWGQKRVQRHAVSEEVR